MSNLRKALKKISFLDQLYQKRKLDNKIKCKYKFVDRRKNADKLCIVLAGYKDFLYEAVFGRLKKYADDDMDICIITSGKWSDTVDAICETNSWSYLSTEINNVSLVQNVAITLHPNANFIYKLDEDIFITKGYFEKLKNCLIRVEEQEDYEVGFVSPVIPINGVGYKLVLRQERLEEEYRKRFELAKYDSLYAKIFKDPGVAKYFWGEDNSVPNIDVLNSHFEMNHGKHFVISIRYSIGAILFRRSFFEKMGMFDVDRKGTNMGMDEVQICHYCVDYAKAMIISEDTVVGHLAFGNQNKIMEQYYHDHKEVFMP